MIEVKTSARLHLGLLDNNGGHGRLYGSIGLAVNQPRLWLRAEPAEDLIAEGLESGRVKAYAERFMRHYGAPGGARLNLLSGIPAHVGLGSGTQIALAVGTALSRLAGLSLGTEEIAMVAGRGSRSGIGIATFRHGGFVVDGGHRLSSGTSAEALDRQPERVRIPPILFRHPVPKEWYFITAVPATDPGISGEKENSAFSRLPGAAAEVAERICGLLLMKMLPALIEEDIIHFGQALTEIQQMVGDCFAAVQGGRYSNPLSTRLIEFLLNEGAAGAGQSSWGPVVYGLVKGRDKARLLTKETRVFLKRLGGGQAFCVQPQNHGAIVREIHAKPAAYA